MRSVRLDDALEARLAEAARRAGMPVSEFIRQAVSRRCDELLADRLDLRLADVIGVACSGGGRARRTGEAFRRALAQRRRSARG